MGDCKSCESNKPNVRQYDIDLLSAMAERTIKRLWVVVLVLIVALIGTNCAWLYYESQFEEIVTTEVVQENADGYNNYIGNDGDIVNGETDNQNN